MQTIFAQQPLPTTDSRGIVPNSIFAVGPTPRDAQTKSWRPELLDLLEKSGFDGYLFAPEREDFALLKGLDYNGQIEWEWEAIARAACVLCWVPRDMATMPALTTNVEFGLICAFKPERVVLGAPDNAASVRYLRYMAENVRQLHQTFGKPVPKVDVPTFNTLPNTVAAALKISKAK